MSEKMLYYIICPVQQKFIPTHPYNDIISCFNIWHHKTEYFVLITYFMRVVKPTILFLTPYSDAEYLKSLLIYVPMQTLTCLLPIVYLNRSIYVVVLEIVLFVIVDCLNQRGEGAEGYIGFLLDPYIGLNEVFSEKFTPSLNPKHGSNLIFFLPLFMNSYKH